MRTRSASRLTLLPAGTGKGLLTVLVLLGVFTLLGACTARYSQSLSGSIPQVQGTPVSTESTGLSVFAITFTEPTPAHEQITQLMGDCQSLNNVEIDYREKLFFILGIPKVSVNATCVRSQ